MSRSEALEAVAEAARHVCHCHMADEYTAEDETWAVEALADALTSLDAARLDATPAQQAVAPTDRELRRVYEDAFVARSEIDPTVTRVTECRAAGHRAVYNVGVEAGVAAERARIVARLRGMAGEWRERAAGMAEREALPIVVANAEFAADALDDAADAIEAER